MRNIEIIHAPPYEGVEPDTSLEPYVPTLERVLKAAIATEAKELPEGIDPDDDVDTGAQIVVQSTSNAWLTVSLGGKQLLHMSKKVEGYGLTRRTKLRIQTAGHHHETRRYKYDPKGVLSPKAEEWIDELVSIDISSRRASLLRSNAQLAATEPFKAWRPTEGRLLNTDEVNERTAALWRLWRDDDDRPISGPSEIRPELPRSATNFVYCLDDVAVLVELNDGGSITMRDVTVTTVEYRGESYEVFVTDYRTKERWHVGMGNIDVEKRLSRLPHFARMLSERRHLEAKSEQLRKEMNNWLQPREWD